jgi:putative DNA primase/helicase
MRAIFEPEHTERRNGNGHKPAQRQPQAPADSGADPLDDELIEVPGLPRVRTSRDTITERLVTLPGEQKSLLLYEGRDHEGHALCVRALYGRKILFSEALGWLYYTGKCWEMSGAEAAVERAIVDTLKARRILGIEYDIETLAKTCAANNGNVTGVKERLQALVTVRVDEFDNHPDLLNCDNGVVDLRTGTLIPHDPAQRFTYALPVAYDPRANDAPWLEFLSDVLTDDSELVDWLQMAVGYSLTGNTWEEVLFYLHGPTRSGKGTFTETIRHLLGKPLYSEVDFETFANNRWGDTQNFDLAPLKPCRFVAASESQKNNPLNPAKIKQLTGGNDVYCAFKHRNHFSYRPQFKIWLSSNHPVNVDVDDDAAWYRVRVIEFPTSHAGREDKTLKRRLSDPDNLAGVLAWAVEGARRWYAAESTNGLPYPDKIKRSTAAHREELDFIGRFIAECCKDAPASFIRNSTLYPAYETWCHDNGVTAKKQRAFSQALKNKGYLPDRGPTGDRGFYGLVLVGSAEVVI